MDLFRRALHHRLAVWFGAAAILVFWLRFALFWNRTGLDFPVFYIAGKIAHGALYDRVAFREYWQQNLAPLGSSHWAYFMRLPVFAFALRPLGLMPYTVGLWTWIGIGAGAYLGAVQILLRRFVLPLPWLLAFLSFYPALVGLISGQDNCFFLLALTIGWLLFEQDRPILAGFAFGLCLVKFNLLVLIPILFGFRRAWSALFSFTLAAALIVSASLAVTPLHTYLAGITDAPKETSGFFPFGLRGLSVAFGQPLWYPLLAAIVLVVCCWLFYRLPSAEAFCVAIAANLLIVPYVCWYDSTLLVLPFARMCASRNARIRFACAALLFSGPAWRFLPFHLTAELFVLAYFFRLSIKSAKSGDSSARSDSMAYGAARGCGRVFTTGLNGAVV